MSIKLIKKLSLATTSAAFCLAAASLAQSAQAATVNYSYTGLTPEQSIQGSFTYADDFAGSQVSWKDLTAFTISYNGGVSLDKTSVESLFSNRKLDYRTSDVTYDYGGGYSYTDKAGSLSIGLTNYSQEGSLHSYQSINYNTWSDSNSDFKKAEAFSSTRDGNWQYASNGWWAYHSPWGIWTSTSNNKLGKSVASVGTWLTEKVSSIAAPDYSCGTSPSVARVELARLE